MTITRRNRKALRRVTPGMKPGPSAREQFAHLLPRLLDSRPVIGHKPTTRNGLGLRVKGAPIFGKPTFRNVIEAGVHV